MTDAVAGRFAGSRKSLGACVTTIVIRLERVLVAECARSVRQVGRVRCALLARLLVLLNRGTRLSRGRISLGKVDEIGIVALLLAMVSAFSSLHARAGSVAARLSVCFRDLDIFGLLQEPARFWRACSACGTAAGGRDTDSTARCRMKGRSSRRRRRGLSGRTGHVGRVVLRGATHARDVGRVGRSHLDSWTIRSSWKEQRCTQELYSKDASEQSSSFGESAE